MMVIIGLEYRGMVWLRISFWGRYFSSHILIICVLYIWTTKPIGGGYITGVGTDMEALTGRMNLEWNK